MTTGTELLDININKVLEVEIRETIIQALPRFLKTISDNIESLRAELRANLAEVKNAIYQ